MTTRAAIVASRASLVLLIWTVLHSPCMGQGYTSDPGFDVQITEVVDWIPGDGTAGWDQVNYTFRWREGDWSLGHYVNTFEEFRANSSLTNWVFNGNIALTPRWVMGTNGPNGSGSVNVRYLVSGDYVALWRQDKATNGVYKLPMSFAYQPFYGASLGGTSLYTCIRYKLTPHRGKSYSEVLGDGLLVQDKLGNYEYIEKDKIPDGNYDVKYADFESTNWWEYCGSVKPIEPMPLPSNVQVSVKNILSVTNAMTNKIEMVNNDFATNTVVNTNAIDPDKLYAYLYQQNLNQAAQNENLKQWFNQQSANDQLNTITIASSIERNGERIDKLVSIFDVSGAGTNLAHDSTQFNITTNVDPDTFTVVSSNGIKTFSGTATNTLGFLQTSGYDLLAVTNANFSGWVADLLPDPTTIPTVDTITISLAGTAFEDRFGVANLVLDLQPFKGAIYDFLYNVQYLVMSFSFLVLLVKTFNKFVAGL